MSAKPPGLASWLLDRIVPRGPEGDTIRGDLLEEYAARRARSVAAAWWWYWIATLSIVLRYRQAGSLGDRSRQPLYQALAQDVRYGIRTLIKAPAFTAVVLITLGLGIGANTAIFSALNAVLLQPLPYPDAGRLVRLSSQNPTMGIENSSVSAADFLDWQRDAPAFESLAVFSTFSTSVGAAAAHTGAERIAGAYEINLFTVLGISPAIGRDFNGGDVHPGTPSAAIVSDGFWRRRYGGDPAMLGKALRPGSPTSFVGVMPRGFSYPDEVELWVPDRLDPASDPRSNRSFEAIGRLRPGVSVTEAQAELDAIARRLETAFPVTNRGWRVRVLPLTDFIVGDARRTLLLLFGGVALVMLVACANVANLFLAHAAGRQREIAVRSAIGAARGRIARQVLTESVLLSLAAGAIGILIGRAGLQVLIAIAGRGIPRLEPATLDRTVLLFTGAMSIGTGILFGLLPALHLSRASLVQALREGTRGAGTNSRTRQLLVIAEVAMALVLLVSAGLLARSFHAVQRIDVGFDPHRLLTMRVTLGGTKYQRPEAAVAYFDSAIQRVSTLPGVQSAAAVLALPVGGGGFYLGRGFIRPGLNHPPEGYDAGFQMVTPGYFRTLGMPVFAGRDFDARDTATSPRAVVINRTLANRFFAGENPIGQKVFVWHDEQAPREIVGIVGDLKSDDVTAVAGAEMYVPNTQSWTNDMTLVARTGAAPAASAAALKAAVEAIDPTQAVYDVKTFDAVMAKALAQQRFSVTLFAGFAGLALALAAVGLYGVMTHVVNGRAHEMGVRLALGARPASVRGLVVNQALRLVAIGLLVGIPASLAAARLFGKLLYGVGPADPLTFVVVVATLTGVAWVSASLPAARATRIDPASALRAD